MLATAKNHATDGDHPTATRKANNPIAPSDHILLVDLRHIPQILLVIILLEPGSSQQLVSLHRQWIVVLFFDYPLVLQRGYSKWLIIEIVGI